MTLSVDDRHDDEVCRTFRHAFEQSGFGKMNNLMTKRDQSITLGGKYDSVNEEEFGRIVNDNNGIVEVVKRLHKLVILKVRELRGYTVFF